MLSHDGLIQPCRALPWTLQEVHHFSITTPPCVRGLYSVGGFIATYVRGMLSGMLCRWTRKVCHLDSLPAKH